MLGRQHMLGGVVAWGLLGPTITADLPTLLGGFAFAVWGSLGPDMDHASSTWTSSFPGGHWVAGRVVRAVGGHRMGTHSLVSIPIAGLLCGAALALAALATVPINLAAGCAWSAAFASGWASHIVLDSMTVMGCAWFWPVSTGRRRIGSLKTSPSASNLNRGELWVARVLLFTAFVLGLKIVGDSIDIARFAAPVGHSAGAGNADPHPAGGSHRGAVRVPARP